MSNPNITLFGSYQSVLKKYADFGGRLSRKGYWYFILINFLISSGLSIIEYSIGGEIGGYTLFSGLYGLALLVPSFAAGVRRLQDTNRSGWNLLLPLIPLVGVIIFLVYLFQMGDQHENQYGPVPNE